MITEIDDPEWSGMGADPAATGNNHQIGMHADQLRQKAEYKKQLETHLAMGHCPHGGGGLRLEDWYWGSEDRPQPTIACSVCDCFGFDPTDPRLRCNPAGGYHSTPHKGCFLR